MPFDSTCRPNDITTQSAQRTSDMNEHILLPDGSIEKQTTTLNLGPTHPATHGVFQNILELDGDNPNPKIYKYVTSGTIQQYS